MVAIGWVLYIAWVLGSIRLEFKGGMHKIIPTSIEKEIFGNYKVYYKASPFAQDTKEKYYYIEKGQDEIVATIEAAILNTEEIAVYYNNYVGLKGFTAPPCSPIVRVEIIKKEDKNERY